jgi:hypothetical protein
MPYLHMGCDPAFRLVRKSTTQGTLSLSSAAPFPTILFTVWAQASLSFLPRASHIRCVSWQAVQAVMTILPGSPFGCDEGFVHEENPHSQIYIKNTNAVPKTTPSPFFIKAPRNLQIIIFLYIRYIEM